MVVWDTIVDFVSFIKLSKIVQTLIERMESYTGKTFVKLYKITLVEYTRSVIANLVEFLVIISKIHWLIAFTL